MDDTFPLGDDAFVKVSAFEDGERIEIRNETNGEGITLSSHTFYHFIEDYDKIFMKPKSVKIFNNQLLVARDGENYSFQTFHFEKSGTCRVDPVSLTLNSLQFATLINTYYLINKSIQSLMFGPVFKTLLLKLSKKNNPKRTTKILNPKFVCRALHDLICKNIDENVTVCFCTDCFLFEQSGKQQCYICSLHADDTEKEDFYSRYFFEGFSLVTPLSLATAVVKTYYPFKITKKNLFIANAEQILHETADLINCYTLVYSTH